jgi:Tol biopolymer transport system component
VVIEPEPSFTPNPSASNTLVLRSDSIALAVDTSTGSVRELLRAPDAGRSAYSTEFPFVFSPDGTSYAFACDDSGTRPASGYMNNLRVSGAQGSEIVAPRGPLEAYGAYTPHQISWSPAGDRISFRKRNRDNAEVADVYVVDLKSMVTTRVIENAGHEPRGPVAWSPDGTSFIIQHVWSGRSSDLIRVDAATGERIDLARGIDRLLAVEGFAWSPSGREVAFVGVTYAESYDAAVFVVSGTGGGARRIMDGTIAAEPLAWSPDGRWIAVTVNVRDPGADYFAYRVFVIRSDGSEERALPDEVSNSRNPHWAPNSSHLAMMGTLRGKNGIVVTSIRGAEPVMVSEESGSSFPDFIVWGGDGRSLYFTREGLCGQGGCTPGYLYVGDATGAEPVRKLYEERISEVVSDGQ